MNGQATAQDALDALLNGGSVGLAARALGEAVRKVTAREKRARRIGEEYLRLQFSSHFRAGKVKHKTLASIEETASRLVTEDERQLWYNYRALGHYYNTYLTSSETFAQQFVRGYFMFVSSACIGYIRDLEPRGVKMPDYLPVGHIPNTDEWARAFKEEIVVPLMYYFAVRALTDIVSDLYAPKDIRLSDNLFSVDFIEERLRDLGRIMKDSGRVPTFQKELCTVGSFAMPDEIVKTLREKIAAYDLTTDEPDFNLARLLTPLMPEADRIITERLKRSLGQAKGAAV